MSLAQVALAILVQFLWALGFVLIKGSLGQFPPILLMGTRFALAAAVLIWFVRPPSGLMGRIFVIVIFSATIPYSAIFTGLKYVDASTAILLIQTQMPFLVLFGVVLLKERIGVRSIAGVAVAFLGIAIIAGEPRLSGQWFAVSLLVLGAVSWGLGQTLIRRLGSVGGMRLLAWVAFFTAPQLFLSSWLFEEGQLAALGSAGLSDWAVILYLGLIMTALGYTLWYRLLGECEVNQVGPFLLLNPVFTVIGSIVLLGERLTVMTILGGVLVLTGVAVVTVRRAAHGAPTLGAR